MMNHDEIKIHPAERLEGELRVPGDKSISHRAVMLAAIAEGATRVEGFLEGEDPLSTVGFFRALGVDIDGPKDGSLTVHGRGPGGLRAPAGVLDARNSGTTMRLGLGILAGQPFEAVVTGDDSLRKRPMGRVAEPLRNMGASVACEGENGTPPVRIRGGALRNIDFNNKLASAQVKSCVLLAGLFAKGTTWVRESRASRDHTERMLAHFGVNVLLEGDKVGVAGPVALEAAPVSVPGDISSAAFLMAAAAGLPGSDIVVEEVGVNATRTGLLTVLWRMGAQVAIQDVRYENAEPRAEIFVQGGPLSAFEIGAEEVPSLIDELPVLAVLATQADGRSVISGARELRVKESDRIAALARNLAALGARVEEREDGLVVEGPGRLSGGEVDSFGDHRIAMAMMVAGLFADSPVTVRGVSCVDISYPGFPRVLEELAE